MNEIGKKYAESEPFPVSPKLTDKILEEIGSLSYEVLAPGVIVFNNAFDIDQSIILNYIDAEAQEAHKKRWTYIVGEDGVEYGLNEDGFRYRLEDIPAAPVRLLEPVVHETKDEVKDIFFYLEEQIYKCLIKYIDHYPLSIGSIWWKNRGHVLRYGDGGILGCHSDNDTNYRVINGIRYMPRGMVAARQTCGALLYLNDCVDSDEDLDGKNFTGGNLRFVHLGISYKPKKGDIIFFPTNYVAAHDVEKMGKGVRYSYLTFFGQGSNDTNVGISISEPEQSKQWCPAVWLNHIYDDYEKYCRSKHSIYNNPEENKVELGWNPVYQLRNVAIFDNTHDSINIEEEKKKNTKSYTEDPNRSNGSN